MSQPKLKPAQSVAFPGPDPMRKVRGIFVMRDGSGLWRRVVAEFDSDVLELGKVIDDKPGRDMGVIMGVVMDDVARESQR